ncbi:MAG TPA: hypothetical protein PKZ22_12495 [Accumulibacter sp.]|jgi:hypothetical protein|nr:hypothetical protein [Accumulibacter sp.]
MPSDWQRKKGECAPDVALSALEGHATSIGRARGIAKSLECEQALQFSLPQILRSMRDKVSDEVR